MPWIWFLTPAVLFGVAWFTTFVAFMSETDPRSCGGSSPGLVLFGMLMAFIGLCFFFFVCGLWWAGYYN